MLSRAQFHPQALGQRAQRVFRALYSVIQGRVILPPMEPTLTIMPAAPLAHVRNHQLHHAKRGEEIQLHQVAGFLHGTRPGGHVEAHAGVVDQDVDGAEAFQCAFMTRAAMGVIGDDRPAVMRASDAPAAAAALRRPSAERAVSEIACAGAGEFRGAGRADAFGRSGNQDDFVLDLQGGEPKVW